VLESANMPAVLVEMGFLTNAAQEKQLTGSNFQNGFVQAMMEAIVTFRDSQSGGPRDQAPQGQQSPPAAGPTVPQGNGR
jgi:hypothetical protein